MNERTGHGEILLIRLVEWSYREAFAARLEKLIQACVHRIAIDLDSVALVNSSMLGLMLKAKNAVQQLGGNLVLIRPSEFVAKP